MNEIFNFICANADYSSYIFFGLLMLAGLNIPISEDLLLLTAGALVSQCLPDNYLSLYLWMFFGCWISGWEAYWIGRLLGPKIYTMRWFQHLITPERIAKLHSYYERFGIWIFIAGRFIPGGVRNALFITSGMGKMPFFLFTARDFLATFISTNVMFYIGYVFGKHHDELFQYVRMYDRIALILLISLVILCYIYGKPIKKRDVPTA